MTRLMRESLFLLQAGVPPRRPRRALPDRTQERRPPLLERLCHERGDVDEPDPAVEERSDGDLVRRVEGAGIGSAALARLAREREQREAVVIGRLEAELEPRP